MDIVDALRSVPGVRLGKGKVSAVVGGYHELAYRGDTLRYVSALNGVTYAVDDYVVFIQSDEAGVVILGAQEPGTMPTLPSPPAPYIVNPTGSSTYDATTGLWTGGTPLLQSPTSWACWFYPAPTTPAPAVPPAAPTPGVPLASFEIEVTRTAAGPPEFATHLNATAVGDLALTGDTYASVDPPLGVPTWISLPIEWGDQLSSGTIKGIAIGGGLFTGQYTGTGRLRFTPV